MKKILVSLSLLLAAIALSAQVKEDFKPATSNQSNRQYPMVNSQRIVRAQVRATDAKSVKLDIGGVKYDLTNDGNGVWTGDSAPQDEGFHYYQLEIDGASVPDPGSLCSRIDHNTLLPAFPAQDIAAGLHHSHCKLIDLHASPPKRKGVHRERLFI